MPQSEWENRDALGAGRILELYRFATNGRIPLVKSNPDLWREQCNFKSSLQCPGRKDSHSHTVKMNVVKAIDGGGRAGLAIWSTDTRSRVDR